MAKAKVIKTYLFPSGQPEVDIDHCLSDPALTSYLTQCQSICQPKICQFSYRKGKTLLPVNSNLRKRLAGGVPMYKEDFCVFNTHEFKFYSIPQVAHRSRISFGHFSTVTTVLLKVTDNNI